MIAQVPPESKKIRVLLADDHPQVLERLQARLEREPDFEVTGVARNSRIVFRTALDERPRLLLIDPMMRDGLGLATLARLSAELPELTIVVLTAIIDTTLAMRLRDMGIRHILTKGMATPDLLAELRLAAA